MKNLLFVFPFLLCSCIDLQNNLSTTHIGGCDEKLSGIWLSKFSGQSGTIYLKSKVTQDCKTVDFTLISLDPNAEEAQLTPSETPLIATFTRVGKVNLINLNPVKPNGQVATMNYLVRYEWNPDNSLQLFLLNNHIVKRLIAKKNILGSIQGKKLILDVSRSNLTAIAKHANHLFDKKILLLRLSDKADARPLYAFPARAR